MNFWQSGFPDVKWLNPGKYVDMAVDYMVIHWKPFLYAIRDVLAAVLLRIEKFLGWLPWWVFVIFIFLLAIWLIDIKTGVLFSAMLFVIGAMGYWQSMIYTLAIVIAAVLLTIIVGIFIGIVISQNKVLRRIIQPVVDAMQTTPSFVYLLPAVMLFGLGKVPAVLATFIYILSPVVRLTNLGIQQVPEATIMAADAFGCSMSQRLFKVQLPQALPTIAAGINQTTLMSLSMVVVTSMIGAKGLGLDILTAISFLDIEDAAEAGLSVIFVAIILDRLTQGFARKIQQHWL